MHKKPELSDEIKKVFANFGKEGGKTRAKNLTSEQRKRIAKKAAQARWKGRASDGGKS